jgi:putative phage-type endonuclease
MSNVIQGSEAWFAQRLGRATASRIADIIAKTKSGYSTSRENYCVELALERITGARQEFYTNDAMKWGTETEPLARAAYEARTGFIVDEVAMVPHPTIAMSGASPDGCIDADGLVEIKCPNSATHMKTLLSKKPDGKYITQMTWQLACTGRQWCDFVSFDPRFPLHLQLFVTRINRDDLAIAAMEAEVGAFLKEVSEMVDQLNNMKAAA